MEAAIFGAVISSTLPWLLKEIRERSKMWGKGRGALDDFDVDSIKWELECIQATIKQYRNNHSHNDIGFLGETLITQLRRLAYKTEDCIDNYRVGRITDEELATMIPKLKKLAEETHEKLHRYINSEEYPKKKAEDLCDVSCDPDHHGGGLGMEEPSDELKALLCESLRSSERKLRVIFITGFGGIGKTLLAHEVYKEQRNQFPRHAFVRMSGRDWKEVLKEIIKTLQDQETIEKAEQHRVSSTRNFGIKKLLPYRLLSHHSQQDVQVEGVHDGNNPTDLPQFVANNGVHGDASVYTDLRTRLRSCLGNNRYLIVIDDMRKEELRYDIISAFPRQEEVDSRIIVTTRQSVAQTCISGIHHVYKMRPLNDEMSKELFVKVAFEDQTTIISDLEKLQLWELQQKCDGVPLALVSIAQYCNGDVSRCQEAWRKLCNMENEYKLARMQRVLKHSYDSLSSFVLQDCLLYLCMFPWGHDIKRGDLIRRWLAEGLALPEDGRGITTSPVEATIANFKALVERNVIRPIQVSINGEVRTCQLPGVMLGYLIGKSVLENFVMLSCDDGATQNPEDIRRLSLHHTSWAADDVRVLIDKDLRHLRTLAVFNKGKEDRLSFSNCLLLRVLDLESCCGLKDSHLDDICKLLRLLKYLSLGSGITKVPEKIENLELLETLHMRKEAVVLVPAEVLQLPNLKHLLGKLKLYRDYTRKKKLIKFLQEGSKLQTVAGFVIGNIPGFPQLMCHMRSLRKVKIWCSPNARYQDLSDLLGSIKEFLYNAESTPRLQHTLSVDFDRCKLWLLNSLLAPGNHQHDDHHPGALSTLKLKGMLTPVPAFVTNLRGITKLCLSSATLCWNAIVAAVSNLKILAYLKLVADNNIKGDIVIQCAQFISLKGLWLDAKQSVPQITIHEGALKHLISLHLLCPVLDVVYSAHQIRHLRSLKEVYLYPGVAHTTWKEAARDHPNRPSVVFVNKP